MTFDSSTFANTDYQNGASVNNSLHRATNLRPERSGSEKDNGRSIGMQATERGCGQSSSGFSVGGLGNHANRPEVGKFVSESPELEMRRSRREVQRIKSRRGEHRWALIFTGELNSRNLGDIANQ